MCVCERESACVSPVCASVSVCVCVHAELYERCV